MPVIVPKKADRFPLFVHQKGYWCKTVLCKHKYFGRVSEDPTGQKALKRWLAEKDFLLAGLEPPTTSDSVIDLKRLCNAFIAAKEGARDRGDIAPRTFLELFNTCKMLLEVLSPTTPAKVIGPEHFLRVINAIYAKCESPNTRGKLVGQCKAIFKHAYTTGLLERPANFGTAFMPPKQKAYREHRNAKGDQTFTQDEIKRLLAVADVNGNAMVLLGLNAAFLNSELAELQRSDIQGEWLSSSRAKTATIRKAWLWPETRAALSAAIEAGPKDGTLVFYQADGRSFSDRLRTGINISKLFTKLAEEAGIKGHSFRDLRYTFQTVAEESLILDLPAIGLVMGHLPSGTDMASRYRQRLSDERINAVCDHVRSWLFGSPKKRGAK